jgi:hypothetical protein
MIIPCDGCICRMCARNSFNGIPYFSDAKTECVRCIYCNLRYRREHKSMAIGACTEFVSQYEQGGATSDGTLPQSDATTRDA